MSKPTKKCLIHKKVKLKINLRLIHNHRQGHDLEIYKTQGTDISGRGWGHTQLVLNYMFSDV